MEWRCCIPIILAVIMFLLVGTIFERRIEIAIRRIIAHQQAYLQANRLSQPEPIRILPGTSQKTKPIYQHKKTVAQTESMKGFDGTFHKTASEVTLTSVSQKSLTERRKIMNSRSVPQIKTLKLLFSNPSLLKPTPKITN